MTESRALGAGLLVSLLINAFFIGALVTRWSQGGMPVPGPGNHPMGPPPALNLRRLAGALPPDMQPHVDEAFRGRRPAMRERMAELLQQRQRVRAALLAEDFEPDALRQELTRLRELDGAVAQGAHDALVELAGRLDAAGRRALADTMGHRKPPGPGEHRRIGPERPRHAPPDPYTPTPAP